MRKYIALLLVFGLCTSGLLAQRVPARLFAWRKIPVQRLQGSSKLAEINISRQLEKRLAQTYRQAKQVQEQLPDSHYVIMGEPVRKILKTWELDPAELYPEQTFLKNATQTGVYLASRNNRLFLQEMRRMEKVWAQIDENLPRLFEEAAATEQPQDPIQFLAQTIPPQTTQLFVGESHGHKEIYQAVAKLVQLLRAQYPQREIFLFTEFLPEKVVWGERTQRSSLPTYFRHYFPIWDQIVKENVPVIGLELPAAVDDQCQVRYLNSQGRLTKQSVWVSLEGVRLRNERWQKTLSHHRAQHPDALFIIYTGADHSLYNRPFTLADNDEHTFVSVLYPNRYSDIELSNRFSGTLVAKPMKGPLERLVKELDFQRDIVRWQSPDLPGISGFDVRIKIPVKLKDIDY